MDLHLHLGIELVNVILCAHQCSKFSFYSKVKYLCIHI